MFFLPSLPLTECGICGVCMFVWLFSHIHEDVPAYMCIYVETRGQFLVSSSIYLHIIFETGCLLAWNSFIIQADCPMGSRGPSVSFPAVLDTGENLPLSFCYIDIVLKQLLITYCYTHRLVNLLTPNTEVSYRKRWHLTRTGKHREFKRVVVI